MKNVLFLLFSCAVFLPQHIHAQLLWKIEGNGISQPSYLFGTIHIVPKEDFLISPEIKTALKSCKTLALETNIDLSLKEQMAIMPMMTLPSGKTLDMYMDTASYQRMMRMMRDTLHIGSMKLSGAMRMKPFFLTALMVDGLYGKLESYEKTLLDMSKKNKMTFAELEPLAAQLALIDGVPIEEQVQSLQKEMSSVALRRQYDQMLTAYKAQDLGQLSAMMTEENGVTADFETKFLHERNQNWIPVIQRLTATNPTFIAVGAGHLAGEKGVIQLLKNAGYTLTPINAKNK